MLIRDLHFSVRTHSVFAQIIEKPGTLPTSAGGNLGAWERIPGPDPSPTAKKSDCPVSSPLPLFPIKFKRNQTSSQGLGDADGLSLT